MNRTNTIFVLLLLLIQTGFSQDNSEQIAEIQVNILTAENGEKLVWMDSLASLVENDANYRYDSLALSTVNYALELDSIHLSLIHI